MLRIGDLSRNLIFQAPSGSPVAWTTIFTCKGAWWPLSGAERIVALASSSTITGKLRIRYRPVAIKTTWRVLVDSKILSIIGPPINLGGRNDYMEISIKETA